MLVNSRCFLINRKDLNMLNRIFKKIDLLNTYASKNKLYYEQLLLKKEELLQLKNKVFEKYDSLIAAYNDNSSILELYVNSNNAKNLVISDDFSYDSFVFENSDFEFLQSKTAYKLKSKNPVPITDVRYFFSERNSMNCITFLFSKTQVVNKLQCSFSHIALGYINPTKIKFIKDGVEYELRENFERYFDRKEEPSNVYYFYSKDIDGVRFYFDEPYNKISVNDVQFFLEEFPPIAELSFKYPIESTQKKLLLKLNYDDFLGSLKFYLYNNNSFKEIELNNKTAQIDNDNNLVFLKVMFNTSNIKKNNQRVLVSESDVLLPIDDFNCYSFLCDTLEEINIDKNLVFYSNFSLMKDLNSYSPNSISLVQDDPVISDSLILYLKDGEDISDAMFNRLQDLDVIEHIEFYKKELIVVSLSLKKIYFAKFLVTEPYKFRVSFSKKIIKEVANVNSYSPFIFDISVSE